MKTIEYRIIHGKYLVVIEWEWSQPWANVEGNEAEMYATVLGVKVIELEKGKVKLNRPEYWQTMEIASEIKSINFEKKIEVYKVSALL